ncbi:HAD family hydrolase [Lentibacillus halophilus]|uniref:Phosphoserine phosphatase n=1 Tax=Lentibacillus halophilus TaxID=295065 RepID=A0ABN0Z9F7_9BACI
MLQAIMFDLDDTLIWDKKSVDEAFRVASEQAAQHYSIDPDVLTNKVKETARKLFSSYDTYSFTEMIGISPFEGLWGVFDDEGDSLQKLKELAPGYRKEAWTKGLTELGVDDPQLGSQLADTFKRERSTKQFVYDETFNVLDQLKGNYQLLLLTNGSPDLQWTKLHVTPELQSYFDHIVISGAFGKGKPDPSIFHHACHLLGVETDEALMIGDNLYSDILGASRAGVSSVWINHHNTDNNDVFPTYEIDRLGALSSIIDAHHKKTGR